MAAEVKCTKGSQFYPLLSQDVIFNSTKAASLTVIKITRQQLCKYWVDASSNLSINGQYFACLSWKVKKHHFNSKVPLKLNFCPWAEKWELNESTVSSRWVSESHEGLYFCQEKVYSHQVHLLSSKWANSLHPFILCFIADNTYQIRIKLRCKTWSYVHIIFIFSNLVTIYSNID